MTTLTPFADMGPVPRVLIDIPVGEFPAGSVTVSLTCTSDGRTMDVRGGQRLPATSPAVVLDAEAAFGVDSSYTITGYDAAGKPVGSLPVGTTRLNFNGTVVQQPLDARLSVQVRRLVTTGAEISRETPSELQYAQGQGLPGMVGLGPRRGVSEVPLDLFVATHADADALQATLGGYGAGDRQLPVWLVRTPPGQRLPRKFFCHVPKLTEVNINGHIGMEYVQMSAVVTEMRPPAVGITAAVLTWSDVTMFYSTYSELAAAYGSWSDVKRDTSMIGAAGA